MSSHECFAYSHHLLKLHKTGETVILLHIDRSQEEVSTFQQFEKDYGDQHWMYTFLKMKGQDWCRSEKHTPDMILYSNKTWQLWYRDGSTAGFVYICIL